MIKFKRQDSQRNKINYDFSINCINYKSSKALKQNVTKTLTARALTIICSQKLPLVISNG